MRWAVSHLCVAACRPLCQDAALETDGLCAVGPNGTGHIRVPPCAWSLPAPDWSKSAGLRVEDSEAKADERAGITGRMHAALAELQKDASAVV